MNTRADTFAAFANAHKPAIDHRLVSILRQQKAGARVDNASYFDVLKHLTAFIDRGGKRLRPLLLLLAYQGYGGKRTSAVMQAAVSQELLHTFLLIHDDIIDRDFHRWGGRNMLGVYFERYSKTMTMSDALHFAEAQALLAGDTCMMLANQTLLSSPFEPALLVAAGQLQQQLVQQVISGEIAETAYSKSPMPGEAQILEVYRQKTASYSFALPLRLGALLAGADAAENEKLNNLADNLGIAFQLQDDLLGTFGSRAVTGKSITGDLREGKRTVLIAKALELTSESDGQKLLKVLGDQETSKASLQAAKTILIDCGSRDYVIELAATYSQAASDKLKSTNMKPSAKVVMQDLITQMATRDR